MGCLISNPLARTLWQRPESFHDNSCPVEVSVNRPKNDVTKGMELNQLLIIDNLAQRIAKLSEWGVANTLDFSAFSSGVCFAL
jgi:hypothetical protein